MAIIQCPECKKQVSDSAEACPNCGFAVKAYIQKQESIERIKIESEREAFAYVENKMAEREAAKRRAEEERRLQKNRSYNKAVELFNQHTEKEIKESEYLFLSLKGWKDTKEYLNKIKDRIEDVRLEEIQKQKTRKKKKRIAIISATSILVILAIVIFVFALILPSTKHNNHIPEIEATKETTQPSTVKPTQKPTQGNTEKTIDYYSMGEPQGNPILIEKELKALKDYEGLYYDNNSDSTYIYTFTINKDLTFDISRTYDGAGTLLIQSISPIKTEDNGYYQVFYDGNKYYHISLTFYENGVVIDGLENYNCNGFYYYGGIVARGN